MNDLPWSTDPDTIKMPHFYFSKQQRLLFQPSNRLSPVSFFNEFWNADILATIVNHTNAFAARLQTLNKKPNARITVWKALTVDEFRKFIGLILLMGIKRMPEIEQYWSRDPALHNPAFSEVSLS